MATNKIQLLFNLVLFCIATTNLNAQNLLFKSSFEEGISLEPPFYDSPDSGTWWQNLKGADASGYSWPINLWGGKGIFQVLVDAKLPSTDYIENTLEIINDRNENPTQAIHLNIKKKAEGWTQDPYIIETDYEGGDIYLRYNLKFESNLKTLLSNDGWLTFFEWKTSGDYRIAAYVYNDDTNGLHWYVHGDSEANGGLPYEEYWFKENLEIDVPQGEWFTVEIFWHRSTGNDGRFWWAIDGKIVADYKGPTRIIEPINRIMLFTAYTSSNTIHHWVDDIEIWDEFPCGDGQPCFDESSLSVSEKELSNDTQFYPNPSKGTITFDLDMIGNQYEIYSPHGQLLASGIFDSNILNTSKIKHSLFLVKIKNIKTGENYFVKVLNQQK